MDSVDLSIIIPTFHRENELVQAIQSVLTNRKAAFEVLVSDDSPEGSAEPFRQEDRRSARPLHEARRSDRRQSRHRSQ